MNKQQLLNFVEVINYGSINRAAEKLYISQPNLSRSIHAMEEELGKDLLVRNNRGVKLTPAGRLVYYYANSIIDQFNTIERLKEVDDHHILSILSLSVNGIFLKDDLILQFYKKIRSENTEIQMLETTAEEVLNNVSTMKSEIGITILSTDQLHYFRKMAESKKIDVEILGSGPTYLHVSKNRPIIDLRTLDVKEFQKRPYLHLPDDFFSNLNITQEIDGFSILDFQRQITMSNYHAMINIINNTDAIMIGHKWQVDELKNCNIDSIKLDMINRDEHFVIIRRQQEILTDAARRFLEIIYDTYAGM